MVGTLVTVVLTSLVALVAVSCTTGPPSSPTASAPARELINPGDFYADASRFGDLVFTAGHLPNLPPGGATFEQQVDTALDNLERTLEASGAGLDTLLQVNVYLADFDDWDAFNTIYVDRIEARGLPPRTTVEVARLGLNARIEISAIAHVRASSPSPTASP